MTEDEVVEWHHRLDGHEFEQALGVGDGQGASVYGVPKSRTQLNDRTDIDNETVPCSRWDLSPPRRVQTHAPAQGALNLNHWTFSEVPEVFSFPAALSGLHSD